MTFVQIISNREQMEAYWRDFEKDWPIEWLPILLEAEPEIAFDQRELSKRKWRWFVNWLTSLASDREDYR